MSLAWWMVKFLISLILLVTHVVKGAPTVNLFAFLPRPRKTWELFFSAVPFVAEALKVGPREDPLPSPPLPWMTRVFIFLVSLLTDIVRPPDGTVRRFISRLDISVGADAKTARSGVHTADVAIDPGRGLWFRLFLPDSPSVTGEKFPVVVFFHGSGFAFLSPASQAYDVICHRIYREIGAAVVSVNYRLSPEHRWPAPYNDGVDVLCFLESYPCKASRFKHVDGPSGWSLMTLFLKVADLSSCLVAGDSAGANIAHHVARRWTAGEEQPHGRVRLAGLIVIQPFFGGERRVESEVRLARGPLVNTEGPAQRGGIHRRASPARRKRRICSQ